MRYWVSWYGGVDGDSRPIKDDEGTPAWACSGSRIATHKNDPCNTICAIIDAKNEEEVWKRVREYWPEAEERFIEEKDPNYLPGDRFQAIKDKV
jgi:hypothetical protein